MLILLPPSEGKTAPLRGRPLDPAGLSFADLAPHRAEVLDALVDLCSTRGPQAAATVLGLGRTQDDEVTTNSRLRQAPTARADHVYSGVLYEALDLRSLDTPARRRASAWLVVTSSLFGLVRPTDRIPAYRLSGDATVPGVGTVAGFWRGHLDPVIRDQVGSGLLVDLRSGTYGAFWRPAPDLARRVVGVRVLHEHQGTRKVVSHFNKATKGRIVRALLEHGGNPRTPGELADLLAELGWKVEVGEPTRKGTQLDVVVDEI